MPANYKYYDTYGVERTITNVLDPLEITSVETTSGSNLVSVSSSSVVYPGQAIHCPGIPLGSFVHSVRKVSANPTILELWRSAFNRTTGVWTTAASNAQATASYTGATAMVFGFSPTAIVEMAYAMGMWRNIISTRATGTQVYTSTLKEVQYSDAFGRGIAIAPPSGSWSGQLFTASGTPSIFLSDELSTTPIKRHNGELHGAYIIVSASGHHSVVQALPGREIIYSPT